MVLSKQKHSSWWRGGHAEHPQSSKSKISLVDYFKYSQDKWSIVEELQLPFLLLWSCWMYSTQQRALQMHQRSWGIIELTPRGIRVKECWVSLHPTMSSKEQLVVEQKWVKDVWCWMWREVIYWSLSEGECWIRWITLANDNTLKSGSVQVNCYVRVCSGQADKQVRKRGGTFTKSTAIKVKVRSLLS